MSGKHIPPLIEWRNGTVTRSIDLNCLFHFELKISAQTLCIFSTKISEEIQKRNELGSWSIQKSNLNLKDNIPLSQKLEHLVSIYSKYNC